jgi:hypothetical protein
MGLRLRLAQLLIDVDRTLVIWVLPLWRLSLLLLLLLLLLLIIRVVRHSCPRSDSSIAISEFQLPLNLPWIYKLGAWRTEMAELNLSQEPIPNF